MLMTQFAPSFGCGTDGLTFENILVHGKVHSPLNDYKLNRSCGFKTSQSSAITMLPVGADVSPRWCSANTHLKTPGQQTDKLPLMSTTCTSHSVYSSSGLCVRGRLKEGINTQIHAQVHNEGPVRPDDRIHLGSHQQLRSCLQSLMRRLLLKLSLPVVPFIFLFIICWLADSSSLSPSCFHLILHSHHHHVCSIAASHPGSPRQGGAAVWWEVQGGLIATCLKQQAL